MPNHVKKLSPAKPLVTAENEPLGAAALAPSTKKLGWLKQYQLSKHQQSAQVEVEKHKTDVLKRQSIDIVEVAGEMQGGLIRAELGRHYGEALGAIGSVMFENYKVIALEQYASRQAGHDANTQAHNEHVADAHARFTRGEITEEQAHIAALTSGDLQAETEARIDSRHKQLTAATDRNFDAAFAPISNTRN